MSKGMEFIAYLLASVLLLIAFSNKTSLEVKNDKQICG